MLNFIGTKALCADVHSLNAAVSFNLDSLDVGIPDSVRSSMRMADIVSEVCTLATNFTFCHNDTSSRFKIQATTYVYYQRHFANARPDFNFLHSFLSHFSEIRFRKGDAPEAAGSAVSCGLPLP